MNMKNKKSNIPAFVSTIGLACLLLLAGCSRDDAQTPDDGTKDGNAIRFTSTIIDFTGSDAANDPETRATINPDGQFHQWRPNKALDLHGRLSRLHYQWHERDVYPDQ